MSLVFAAVLAATSVTLPVCSWDSPGMNPFRGDVAAAVDRYTDIPAPVRAALKERVVARKYDEVAAIRRDAIEGEYAYSDLRDMHFGQGQVCRTVTRSKWAEDAVERGLVYCESGHCLIVPTVCRNLSRITRGPSLQTAAPGRPGGDGEGTAMAPQDELEFDPPGAGGKPAAAPASFAGLAAAPRAASVPAGYGSPAWATAPQWGADTWSSPGPGGSYRVTPGVRETNGLQSGPIPLPENMSGLNPLPQIDAALAPVPEPGTWAMLIAGLALLMPVLRRQRLQGM